MGTCKMPEELLEQNQIQQMAVGQAGYVVPWAMMVDMGDYCHLCGTYTYHPKPGGTVQMLVEHRPDGYHVTVGNGCNYYRWQRSRSIPWVGCDRDDLVSVVAVHH